MEKEEKKWCLSSQSVISQFWRKKQRKQFSCVVFLTLTAVLSDTDFTTLRTRHFSVAHALPQSLVPAPTTLPPGLAATTCESPCGIAWPGTAPIASLLSRAWKDYEGLGNQLWVCWKQNVTFMLSVVHYKLFYVTVADHRYSIFILPGLVPTCIPVFYALWRV